MLVQRRDDVKELLAPYDKKLAAAEAAQAAPSAVDYPGVTVTVTPLGETEAPRAKKGDTKQTQRKA